MKKNTKEKVLKFLSVLSNIGNILSGVAFIATFLGAFWLFFSDVFKNFIISSTTMEDNAFPFLSWVFLAAIFIISALSLWVFFLTKRKVLYISTSDDRRRIKALKKLDNAADKSIYIMGIGLTGVADSLDEIKKALEEKSNMHIIVLTIDDKIASNEDEYSYPFASNKISLRDYIRNTYGVGLSVAQSNRQTQRIEEFIAERREERAGREACGEAFNGRIELRKYSSFLPMNITIADKTDEKSKVIVEYFMPFDPKKNRIRLVINEFNYLSKGFKEVADNAKAIVDRLLQESESFPKITDDEQPRELTRAEK